MTTNKQVTKQCVILSGKGGTGKTSLSASLANISSQTLPSVFIDADVDAANLALVTGAKHQETHTFSSSKLAKIDPALCDPCGICFDVCRFDAIRIPSSNEDPYQVNALLCDGCAACVYACPQSAIQMETQEDGKWFHSITSFGHLFHAELFPGGENSGKLVTEIKQHAKNFADNNNVSMILIDGPPGIGCPVISASTGTDLALLVAEPGVSGVHDLERIIQTLEHFNIPILIAINKADLYPQGTQTIRELAESRGYEVCGEIPFESKIPQAMMQAQSITEFAPDSPASHEIRRIWEKVQSQLFGHLGDVE